MKRLSLLCAWVLCCFLVFGCVSKSKQITRGVSFSITSPDSIFEGDKREVVLHDKVLQVIYKGMERIAFINKSLDEGEEDNVMDFNDYPEISEEIYNNIKVKLYGMDGKINVLSWKSGGYNYSININPAGLGMDKQQILDLISKIK